MSDAYAVFRYTVVELGRRRVLLAIVAAALLLMAGIALAPYVLPGNAKPVDRLIVSLTGLVEIVPNALLLCSLAIGMTVVNHDLDSGAVVSIFAKPISRASYTAGKIFAAILLLLSLAAIFTVGSLVAVAVDGGGAYQVVFWQSAALAANVLLLMLLVTTLTVYMNNVIAAAVGLAFNFVAGSVLSLHTMVAYNAITGAVARAVVEVAYWGVPHHLTSDLQRQILQMRIDAHVVAFRGTDPFRDIPGASGGADLAFWLAYTLVICGLFFLAVRRKQV